MLAPLNHAMVKYELAHQVSNHNNNNNSLGGSGSSEEALPSKEESTLMADGRKYREGGERGRGGGEGVETNANSVASGAGGFYFSDGGQETDFAAAFRIRVGEGNRDWPLTQV